MAANLIACIENEGLAPAPTAGIDWHGVARNALLSRALDDLEELRLLPGRQVLYQFCARGHEVTQSLLGIALTGARDAVASYYRTRPLMLSLGLPLEDALASTMMRTGGVSGGRDIGVIFNLPRRDGPCVLPGAGGVGSQFTPAVGWAQSLQYRAEVLGDATAVGSIAVATGGEASVASNGFWAALNVATTQRLPILFYIEDNGYGISVPSTMQTPGGDIACNLSGFSNLAVFSAAGDEPWQALHDIHRAVAHVRSGSGPALVRMRVPRLSGHSGQDNQSYKSEAEVAAERARDPLRALQRWLVPQICSPQDWAELEQEAQSRVEAALEAVTRRPSPPGDAATWAVFTPRNEHGEWLLQQQGGLRGDGVFPQAGNPTAHPSGPRINMVAAIRRTLEVELASNPRVLVYGEDVGLKGGVHAVTQGLQQRFGTSRVFDTSLNEEGIIGRAIGLAAAGLMPVAEIQFRKYADPAAEQLHDIGTLRWRTHNRFAAPVVVRMPGGYFKCGDPWHSQCNEVEFVHAIGWQVAMPSNAEDAVGLLRSALRSNEPTIFFEHRAMLDAAWARRPYPGDDYIIEFGRGRTVIQGERATVVTWGAMTERCQHAIEKHSLDAELIDLRTVAPWDRELVLASVRRTGRCIVVHEDTITAGFGAEIVAVIAREAFYALDAPIERLAMPDIPSPHSPTLLEAVLPDVPRIAEAIRLLIEA
jgi:2-oxoisovalerate dehydrogenase E1 component